jgi:hypothetical protein
MTDVMTNERKKPGRPRKFGQGRINATVRFTPDRYAALKQAAANKGRSVSEEVEARVEESILEESLQDIRSDIKEVSTNIQKLTAANLTTSPPVITEASLTQKSTGTELLDKALASISELEKLQTLNEEMVERAVARVLARTRLTTGNNGAVEGSGT